MITLIVLVAIFVVSSGLSALTGKALMETVKCWGKEIYWDMRGRK